MWEHMLTNNSGCFVLGKFDLLQTSKEPYSAIAAAFSDICDIILRSKNPLDARRSAHVALGPESKILSRVVTNIANITGEECGNERYIVGNEDFAIFVVAYKHFLGAVATNERPLLIFLDDLQWSDHSSFRLIEALLTYNSDFQHVLFCLAYPRNDVDVGGKLRRDLWGSKHPLFSEIVVTNFDRSDRTSMLSGLLLVRKDDSLKILVTLVHEKTKGNPHAVVQLMDYFLSKDLLYFTPKTNSWDWNEDGVAAEVSDNPSEIIANKVNSLDDTVQELLQLAAFVGHMFEVDGQMMT